jgi:hypothetical protein
VFLEYPEVPEDLGFLVDLEVPEVPEDLGFLECPVMRCLE